MGVALGFVGNYAPRGLSPQIDGVPVIHANYPSVFLTDNLCLELLFIAQPNEYSPFSNMGDFASLTSKVSVFVS